MILYCGRCRRNYPREAFTVKRQPRMLELSGREMVTATHLKEKRGCGYATRQPEGAILATRQPASR